jgi:hypothetical protein
MQPTSFWDTIQQVIRIAMQFVGGWLVSKGILTEELAVQLTGGILSIAGVIWWIFWDKSRALPK